MAATPPSISIIVPTLNEAENIEGIVGRILAGGAGLEMEIIVVDDGSKDATQAIVRRLSETLPVILLARDRPKDGLAGAVLAGARAARAGVVLVIDADGSHPPEKIPELAQPVIRGELDMVIGSRYAPGGSTPGWSRRRRLMSRAASAAAWPLTDVHDALSGYFAVRQELLAGIPSDAAGFKIALEVLVRGGDTLRVGEVPIAFKDRELGQSKMGTKVILTYFQRLLALSGWRESQDTMRTAILKTATVWGLDLAVFAVIFMARHDLGISNAAGFAAGAVLNAALKSAQAPAHARGTLQFLMRLLFVSLLAFFLRTGTVGTCVLALRWPWYAGIVPAIVLSWAVLFLGYALFIWPVRDQYGSGVRWRVAAIGATAYMLALRIAYLYVLPLNRAAPSRWGWSRELTASVTSAMDKAPLPGIARYNAPALLCWLVGAVAVFKTGQRTFDKTIAFRSLLLFSVLPMFFWPGSIFMEKSLWIAAFAVVMWGFSFFKTDSRWPYILLFPLVAVWIFFNSNTGPLWLYSPIGGFGLPTLAGVQLLLCVVAAAGAPWTAGKKTSETGTPASDTGPAWIALRACVLAMTENMWLAVLPMIARGMQPRGRRQSMIWVPAIYACVILDGLYLCWLAYTS